MFESSKRPSDAPLPENEIRNAAIPARDRPSARATRKGRSLCAVTPWPMTTTGPSISVPG